MIVSVLNKEGGSGKTTLSVHLAASLARDGAKVLLADADPEGSALEGSRVIIAGADALTARHIYQ